jgi:hypothetical protein
MRTLLVGALTATLVGCSCFVSPETGIQVCTGADGSGFACLDRTAVDQTGEPETASPNANFSAPKAKAKVAPRRKRPSSASGSGGSHVAAVTANSSKVAELPASDRPAEAADPVTAKAKITVAAKLENPASAEFGEMKRAMRINMLGQSVDTICGRIKGKKTSGEATQDMPFLYLVKDDEAYVVDGPPTSAAASAYRNICN